MSENNTASRFDELDPAVKEMLRKLEPEEVVNLKYLATLSKVEVQGVMKFIRDIRAAGWYIRWGVATLVALFLTAMVVGENIMKLIGWIKGAPPQ